MFYQVFHKASAVTQSTTSLNMDSRPEITVFTELAFCLHNLPLSKASYILYVCTIREAGNESDFDSPFVIIVLSWIRPNKKCFVKNKSKQ